MALLRIYHGAGCIAMGWAQLVKEPEVGREIAFGAPNPRVWLVGCSCTRAAQLNTHDGVGSTVVVCPRVYFIVFYFSALGSDV